jgi:predicted pyridoxine 5'-phosphate oxidase superfamily flavin-nucleotide-binding protein
MVGLLVIDPATRRRMRANGRARACAPGHLCIQVDQAYANCPKYIQKRRIDHTAAEAVTVGSAAIHYHTLLRPEHRALVADADTFFMATLHPERGADASHRGGTPGFVAVSDDGRSLLWPDYAGNAMFNTLGNLAVFPTAGVLFIDWTRGSILQISGEAEILWDGPDVERFPGAERSVAFQIAEVVYREAEFPFRYHLEEMSPFLPG